MVNRDNIRVVSYNVISPRALNFCVIKDRTILDDIDDMNKANIDELFGGRKRNADGGLAKILEV